MATEGGGMDPGSNPAVNGSETESNQTPSQPPKRRSITTVTLTEENRSSSGRSASISGLGDNSHNLVEIRSSRASTLPSSQRNINSDTQWIVSQTAAAESQTAAASISCQADRTGAASGAAQMLVKPKTSASGRTNHTPSSVQNSQSGSHGRSQSEGYSRANPVSSSNTCVTSSVSTGRHVSNSRHQAGASVMSHTRDVERSSRENAIGGCDRKNASSSAIAAVTSQSVSSTNASQSNQMPSSITVSSQTLPLTVARGTVASVCVGNRSRNASPPRGSPPTRHTRAQLRSQSSSPSRLRGEGQGQRPHCRTGSRGRRASNQNQQNQSRGQENGSRLGNSVSGSEHSSNVNIPQGLDANQLSVDVLQSTHQNNGSPSPSSPNRSIRQWCENNEALPDILNSHLLPPYGAPRQNQRRHVQRSQADHQTRGGNRNRGRVHRHRSSQGITQLEEDDKQCCTRQHCLRCATKVTTFRWVLVCLAVLGVVCVAIGIVLGSLHMTTPHSFLVLSLMFIGLGVMLVVVVGIGWRCTPHGHEPCHLLFNLGAHSNQSSSRASAPGRNRRDRNEWHGGVVYSEFRHRRPPPSYNASQDYQQRLVTSQLQADENGPEVGDNLSLPSSPPPTYRSRASTTRPGIHITFPPPQGDYPSSRPPTYRSHMGEIDRPSLSSITQTDNTNCSASYNNISPICIDSHPMANGNSEFNSNLIFSSQRRLESPLSTLHRVNEVVQYLDEVLDDQNVDVSVSPSPDSLSRTSMDNIECTRGSETTENSAQNRPRFSSDTYRIEVSHILDQPQISVLSRASNSQGGISSVNAPEQARAKNAAAESPGLGNVENVLHLGNSRPPSHSLHRSQNPQNEEPISTEPNKIPSELSEQIKIQIIDVGTQTGSIEEEDPEVADTQL